jgi:putative addiction module killer protein
MSLLMAALEVVEVFGFADGGKGDRTARVKIQTRLGRLLLGNFGDSKFVGEGVYELRIDYGGGYRIYFGQVGSRVILLLCGGEKSSQERDIQTAKSYWRDYAKR